MGKNSPGWISRFGVPSIITSDRGTQFTSSLWSNICSLLNINHTSTTAFHPQANGMIERFHRQLKNSLRACLASADCYDHLPCVLLGLHSTHREDSATSASEAVRFDPSLSEVQDPLSSQFYAELRKSMSESRPVPVCHNMSPTTNILETIPAALSTCSMVLVQKDGHVPPLAPPYAWPYRFLSHSSRTFKLQVGPREEVVSVHRLKPAVTSDDQVQAQPPQTGHPPKCPPPLVPPPPPRAWGRPRKVKVSAVALPQERKSVRIRNLPTFIWKFFLYAWPLGGGWGVLWKTIFSTSRSLKSSTKPNQIYSGFMCSYQLFWYLIF